MESKHTPEPWSNAGIKAERDKLRAVNAELLAALQRLSAAAMAYSSLDDEVAEARAAIAKATGE